MALLKKITPAKITPVHNPIPISYSSNFSNQSGFRYKYTLRNDSSTGSTIVSTHIYPDIQHDYYGLWDVSMILKEYVDNRIDLWNTSGVTNDPNAIKKYGWTITEYIGSTSSATNSDGPYWAFRGVKQYGDYWDVSEYVPGTNWNNCKFLSNWSGNRKYKTNESATINVLGGLFTDSFNASWNRMKISVDGTSPYYIYIQGVASQTTAVTPGVYVLPLGPTNINAARKYSAAGVSGYTSIISSSTDYYTIVLEDYSLGWLPVSKTIRVDVDKTCYKYDPTQIVWVGELGTLETFVFRMANTKKFDTKREIVKRLPYELKTSIPRSYTYSIGKRGYDVINLVSNESHSVVSDWITDKESESLIEMYFSPSVFLVSGTNLYPIIIEDKKIVEKKTKTHRLFNHELEYSMAFEKLSNI